MSKISKALEKAAREKGVQPDKVDLTGAKSVSIAGARHIGDWNVDDHIVTISDPKSVVAEQYRILRTNLQSLKSSSQLKSLLVTSSVRNEGKSVSSINLAIAIAKNPAKQVLLVDADMRKGSLQDYLNLEAHDGLSEVLTDDIPFQDVLLKTQSDNLYILPSGKLVHHASELLDTDRAHTLFKALRARFDCVVVDSPPVIPLADSCILASMVDGVILVVQAGRTQKSVVNEAKSLLEQNQANILGAIMSHAEFYVPKYGHYRKYGYGYYYGARKVVKK